jgi:tRNA-dihydrouridine synthase B
MSFPTIKIGSLLLETPLLLSPLAGYTNLPFRLVIREIGSIGLCTTDLVNARSLIERNHKAIKLIETRAADQPMAVQLFGSVASEMSEAAKICEQSGAASVDVNMGCPVRKVCQVGGGSAMMTEWQKTAQLVKGMVDAVKIPVTCKMRLGWDDDNITAPDLARALEEVGVAAIVVHGRTRQQGFDGQVKLAGIRKVVEAVKSIPIIGNGDVTTPEAAKKMIDSTGCAGVSVGRGAFYNPWIFAHTWHYLNTGELLPEPGFDERLRVMTRHLDLMIEVFGEGVGCRMFRKVGPWYAKHVGPASFFNKKVVMLMTRTEFDEIVAGYRQWRAQFLDSNGALLPRFAAAPIGMNFSESSTVQEMQATPGDEDGEGIPAVAKRSSIPVPSGPNELW